MAVDAAARTALPVVPALYGGAAAAQIAYPLLSGSARAALTVVVVLLVAAAAIGHAALTRGWAVAAWFVAVTVGGGFAVELLGVHTGAPFGRYHYASALGPALGGVPLVIAFAWPMLAWPAALAARRLVIPFPVRVLVGAWALAAWDLFLDPQMVAAGYWTWHHPAVHLPGVPAVPVSDYVGWLLAAVLVSLALQLALRHPSDADADTDADDRWPLAFYVWTWASSTLALGAFLHLGAAAAWGALGMGVVALPLARSSWRRR